MFNDDSFSGSVPAEVCTRSVNGRMCREPLNTNGACWACDSVCPCGEIVPATFVPDADGVTLCGGPECDNGAWAKSVEAEAEALRLLNGPCEEEDTGGVPRPIGEDEFATSETVVERTMTDAQLAELLQADAASRRFAEAA